MTNEYKFGVAAQKAKVFQAFKDQMYERIDQTQLGMILIEAGTKLMMREQPTPNQTIEEAVQQFKKAGLL